LRGGGRHIKFQFKMSDALCEMIKKTPSGKHRKYSITRKGMSKIFSKLLVIAREERGFVGKDLTSHDCAALFQGKSWICGRWAENKDERMQFHPMDKFPQHFSDKMPDRVLSYPWAEFGLIEILPLFLDACEQEVLAEDDTTLWLDILFTDQNSHDIKLYLKIADQLYSEAELHFAFIFGGLLSRAWCISEIITRFRSFLIRLGLWKEGQDNTQAVIHGGELLRDSCVASTIFVFVKGFTDLNRDVTRYGNFDRFECMAAFDPNDLREIKESILALFGTAAAFNFMLVVVRNAIISRYAARYPVRGDSPPLVRAPIDTIRH
jgi:hypothetical protein